MSAGAKLAGFIVFAVLYGAVAAGVYSLAGGVVGKAGALFWPYSIISLFGYAVPVSILLGVSSGVDFYVCRLKDKLKTGAAPDWLPGQCSRPCMPPWAQACTASAGITGWRCSGLLSSCFRG